ncbi:MAG: hypothetical protein ABJF11_18865 [Reichenbachiella sp.]|uniref:hypothetical protein n=1 Tax=Reichenbachiella sp. TaxID=2184521 RepID=UPI003265672B
MNRILNILILCALSGFWLCGCMSEDSNSLETSDIFIKYYGSESAEETIDLIELSDGYLLLGSRTDVDNTDIYLVRTDSAGNRMWENVIDNDITGNTEATSTIDIPSKMYYDEARDVLHIVGTSSFDREDDDLEKVQVDHLFLANLTIDNTGFTVTDTLIYRYYDERSSVNASYVPSFKAVSGADVLPIGNNELLVLGTVEAGSNDPSFSDNSVLLMRISNDFQTVNWERVKGFGSDDFGRSLLVAGNNYYYMGALTTTSGVGNGGIDVLVEEFNPISGNENNQIEYGTADNDEGYNMIYTNPGIAIVGTTGTGSVQYAFMLKISSNLGAAQIKTLTYPEDENQDWNTQGADLAQTASGDFFVVGTVNSFTDGADPREDEIVLLPTNSVGEVYEGDVQEYGSVQSDAGNAIIRKSDGTMVIGATVHFGGSATMMSLMKTNKNGEFLRN